MTDATKRMFAHVRMELRAVLALLIIALALWGFAARGTHQAFVSPEVRFADASPLGMQIVPASCPSYAHYSGQCDAAPPPVSKASRGRCGIGISPTYLSQAGQSATLSWNAEPYNDGFLSSWSYGAGSIDNGIGAVPSSGSVLVVPAQTTVYRFTGYYNVSSFFSNGTSPFSCGVIVTVGTTPGCPSGYTLQNGQCVAPSGCTPRYSCSGSDLYYQHETTIGTGCKPSLGGSQQVCTGTATSCTNDFVQHCAYGCSASACVPAPGIEFVPFDATNANGGFHASGHLQVRPALVRSGDTVQVYWNVQNATDCSVTGTNSDAWDVLSSGAAGKTSKPIDGQTIYTLSCHALPGASPSVVTENQTVNIIPVFQEQ